MKNLPAVPLKLDAFMKALLVLLVVAVVVLIIQTRRPVRVELSANQPLGLSVVGGLPVAVVMASPVTVGLPQPEPAPAVERRRAGFVVEPPDQVEV